MGYEVKNPLLLSPYPVVTKAQTARHINCVNYAKENL
jgi:hypothetical protein